MKLKINVFINLLILNWITPKCLARWALSDKNEEEEEKKLCIKFSNE